MINNDTPMSSNNNTPSTSYAGLINQRTLHIDDKTFFDKLDTFATSECKEQLIATA